jgi:hypothetical protein
VNPEARGTEVWICTRRRTSLATLTTHNCLGAPVAAVAAVTPELGGSRAGALWDGARGPGSWGRGQAHGDLGTGSGARREDIWELGRNLPLGDLDDLAGRGRGARARESNGRRSRAGAFAAEAPPRAGLNGAPPGIRPIGGRAAAAWRLFVGADWLRAPSGAASRPRSAGEQVSNERAGGSASFMWPGRWLRRAPPEAGRGGAPWAVVPRLPPSGARHTRGF